MGITRLLLLAPLAALALFGFAPRGLAADQPLSLTDAIGRAINGNVDLRRERIAVDVTEAQLEVARGASTSASPAT